MRDPHWLAEVHGFKIEYTGLAHLNRDGDSNPDTGVIRLQEGMLPRLERSVLAHEISHMTRGDRRSIFGFYDDRDERTADEFAAHYLIGPAEFRAAEERCGNNVEAIAQELDVMDFIVEAYVRTICRIGNNVYFHARMGEGQWSMRMEAV